MAVELDTDGNGAIDIEKGGTNATSAVQALSNLGGQPYDADLDILSSGSFSQKRALIEAFAKPVLGVDALRTTMADFDGDCRYLAYHTASGDGGHGTFYWDAASAEEDDGQDTIAVTGVSTGRWKRNIDPITDELLTHINLTTAQALQDAQTYADGKFVTQVLHQEDIDNLQSQVDGQVVAWFYDYAPTLSNAPASLWTTEALRDQHANDTFTHLITGQSWRWVYDAGAWKWLEIADTATTAALAAASQAQDTADNKRRVFTAQPTVPYDEGDLWADGTTLLRCVTPKTSTGSYAAGDWVAVATKAPQLPPDVDLFAHWDFDDTLLDRVSLLTPTQYGTGGYVGGISGRGRNFVYATKDYLKLPAGAMAGIANGTGFTLSLWFKADSDQMYANPRIFTIAETNLNFTLGLQGTAPSPLYPVVRYAGAVKYSPVAVSQGEWHHIVVRVNSLTAWDVTLWLDGVLCTNWVTEGINGNAIFNAIGGYDGTGYGWTGAIDEVRVYNTKTITDDHVRALYLNPGGSSKNVAPDVDKTDYVTIYANTETFPAVVTPTTMKRTGSTFEKVGTTTAWDAQAYSPQRYTGGCRLAFKTGTPNKAFMMGFAFDPTLSVIYSSTDYQFYLKSDATVFVYEKATQVNIGAPTFTTDTLFEIIYDGSEVRYLMDGVVKRTVTGLDFNLSFCLDSSFYSAGSKATNVQWGPYSPPLSVVQARAELARTTAQAYADGEITAAEQRAIAEAQAKADLAEANANAYADGKVTAAEQRAIDAAQAKADLAETNAKAWADGIVTAEEQRSIQDAQAKADAAELAAKEYADVIVLSAEQRAALDAQAKATVAETTAKAYADGQVTAAEQRAIADAQSKALMGHNLLNWYESWVPGTGSTGQFIRNSTDAENMRALAVGPFGQREIVWQSIPSGDGGADGGFITATPVGGFSVDPDKTYIYGCYMQRLTGNGSIYLGCAQVKNLSDVVNTNPHFAYTSLLNSAKWMLAIGVIHPRGYTGPATGMSGFYDVETGVKLVTGSDFKIDDTLADPTVQIMRAFQYNSTTGNGVTVEAQFARPFVMEASVCPPIDQLTGKLSTIAAGADVTDYANTETFPAVLTPDVMKRTGSTFEKTGGVAGWNAQAYSLQGYTGGCRLAFKAGVTTLNFMAGINTDPATDASYTSVDYQFYMLSNVTVGIYEGSTLRSIGYPPFTTDTLFEIIYDGSEIRYLMDGVTKRTVTGLDAGLTFYMDLSFSSVGSKATHVQWGPYAPPLSVVKALALAAETEAKAFADGIVTAEEQRAIADAHAKANAAQAAAESNAKSYADTTFVTQVLHQAAVDNLQGQLDGQVIAWFYDYAPTLSNAPASLWTTEALRDQHANDTFTHLITGQSWRWVYDAGAWKWLEIADTATTAALAAASQAQDTADNKRRVFVAQPTVPYDVGDLWADGSTLLRCVTPKTSTGSYAAGDWMAVADKTDYTNTETFPAAITPDLMVRRGSTFERVAGSNGWLSQAYSANKYTGGCRVAFRAGSVNKAMALGIDADPTLNTSYTSIDYCFYLQGNGLVTIYESGTDRAIGTPPYTTNTLFEIIYDGAEVRYLMDGVVVRTVTGLANNLTFYMDSSFYIIGGKVTHVEWGPYGPTLSVAQTLASTAEANAQTYADGKFVTQVLHQEDIDNLQSQIDGQVVAWFYDYAPTLSNAPASLWTTEALQDQHANDTFTHLITGQSWRWVYDAGAWKWLEIVDTATTAALAAASQAQDTADNKRRVFTAQPIPPYDEGDLWANGPTLLRCVTPKTTEGSYAAGDWVAVADKTDYANTETFPVAITPDLMVRRGSTFERVAGSDGWLSQAYSANKYTGGCRVAFRAGSVDKAIALGVNADPTLNTSYTSIDYCFYLQGNGLVAIYESGTARAIGTPPYTTNTLFEIIYDGAEVRYLMDGVVVRTVTGLANNLTFYMDSSFYIIGGKVTHVEWGPYGPTLSVAQTLASTAEANAKSYADGNFVTKVLHQTDISNLQSQVDGQVSAWFYSYAPTTANAPASSWTTVALKEQHANDTFTRLDTGQSWRWVNTAGVWGWTEIADTATVTALAAAAQAQDTADNKRRVFVATPTVPYDIGDLWTTGSTISRCVTAKTTAGSYAAGDWVAVADATNYDDYRVSNVRTENSVTTIARPVGGTYHNSGASVTGAIKITLPQSWSSTMIKFGVDIRQYNTTKSFTLHLGGYNYSTTTRWVNSFAQLAGSTASNNRVRFGHDGTKCCILIGDVTSVWNLPSVVVKDFQASASNMTRDKWETGWAISIVTDISGITTTADIPDTLIDAKSILGQGALATQNTADYGTQVTGTKPPADADSTTTVIGRGLITTGFIGNKGKTDPLLTLGINFDTAEIFVGAAAGLKVKSGGGITVESGGGVTVKDGGALSMEAGGDLVLTADNTNPSTIQFKKSPTDTSPVIISGNVDTGYYAGLSIMPSGPNLSKIDIGSISREFTKISMVARSVFISSNPPGCYPSYPVGFITDNYSGTCYGSAQILAVSEGIRARCTCTTVERIGVAQLESSDSTSVASDTKVTITAPDITITGSNGTKISAPIRTANPTASEVPNNQVMIYTVGTATRLAANINGTMYIRTL